jgi:hypothetical protein
MKEKRFKESFDILATILEHVAEIWRFEFLIFFGNLWKLGL